jgi:thiol-disulfide isomerase/thioredoxin
MSTFSQSIFRAFQSYQTIILVIFLILVFIGAVYFFLGTSTLSSVIQKPSTDLANYGNNSNADIYFFFVTWCPHCNTAKPEWTRFCQQYDGQMFHGHKLTCHSVDCTNDNQDPAITEMIQKYDIRSYPTVKMVVENGPTVEFDAKVKSDALLTFVQNILAG